MSENFIEEFMQGFVAGSTLVLTAYAVVLLWRIEGRLRRMKE